MEGAVMDFGIQEIGRFALSVALAGAPVAVPMVLIALLNHRDRRQDRLLALAARQLTGEEVRGATAVEAHCPLLAGGGVIRVDPGGLEGAVARLVVERLRQALPPMIRLAVVGTPDPAHTVGLVGPRRVLRTRPS
jgi:hypothetical protein